jgi:hypothetical protein
MMMMMTTTMMKSTFFSFVAGGGGGGGLFWSVFINFVLVAAVLFFFSFFSFFLLFLSLFFPRLAHHLLAQDSAEDGGALSAVWQSYHDGARESAHDCPVHVPRPIGGAKHNDPRGIGAQEAVPQCQKLQTKKKGMSHKMML